MCPQWKPHWEITQRSWCDDWSTSQEAGSLRKALLAGSMPLRWSTGGSRHRTSAASWVEPVNHMSTRVYLDHGRHTTACGAVVSRVWHHTPSPAESHHESILLVHSLLRLPSYKARLAEGATPRQSSQSLSPWLSRHQWPKSQTPWGQCLCPAPWHLCDPLSPCLTTTHLPPLWEITYRSKVFFFK